MRIKLLKFPYPYKSWFALSNDPDYTTMERWDELHRFLWEELKLPLSDSLFVKSFNKNIPGQVNLFDNGMAILRHSYDTIHTWGDYVSAEKVFNRKDAKEASKLLLQNNIKPSVWVDHSSFVGNFIMNSSKGAESHLLDAAGYRYVNPNYSIDIAHKMGIRYLWDGQVSDSIKVEPVIYKRRYLDRLSEWIFINSKRVLSRLFNLRLIKDNHSELNNHALKVVEFEKGIKMYLFRRFGSWRDAHIDGVPNLINRKNLENLVKKESICVFYTHLGKKKADKVTDKIHIPPKTADSFTLLKRYYDDKKIKVSSLSGLLDYVVLRDSLKIEDSRIISFRSDGIRFNPLHASDLSGHSFSFNISKGISLSDISVRIDSAEVSDYRVVTDEPGVITIMF